MLNLYCIHSARLFVKTFVRFSVKNVLASIVLVSLLMLSLPGQVMAAPGDTNPGALTLKAAYQSISIYAHFTGDSGGDNSATLHYRTPPGFDSWIPGMDMTVDRRTIVDSQATPYYNQWRASILGLQPNTTYEVRITFTDGGQQGMVTGTITTRNDDFDSLSPGGIDNGVPITGFNDRYSAWPSNGNPDMGAYENGATSEDNEPPYTTGHDPAIEAVKISPDTNLSYYQGEKMEH